MRLDLGEMLPISFTLHWKIKWHKIEHLANLHRHHHIRPRIQSTSNEKTSLGKVSSTTAVIYIPEADHQRTDVAQLQVTKPIWQATDTN
jgi:hypothetical protein